MVCHQTVSWPCRLALAAVLASAAAPAAAQVPGPNVNMISIDKYLQKQNEVDLALSPVNPCHVAGAANDYRTVNNRGLNADGETGDAWIGLYVSTDCGETFLNYLVPGYVPGLAGADPMPRFGPGGGLFLSYITFSRGSNVGTISLARYRDYNDVEGVPGPPTGIEDQHNPAFSPIRHVGTTVVARGSEGRFLDKSSLAVGAGSGAPCTLEDGTTLPATNLYVAWTDFVGNSTNNSRSKVYFARSTDCGRSFSSPATKLSESFPLNQGTVIAVNPANPAEILVAWRRVRDGKSPDQVLYVRSTNGGRSFTKAKPVPHFDGATLLPQGAPYRPFDQFTSSTRFRTLGYPTLVFGDNGRAYLAASARIGPARTLPDGTTARDGRVVLTSTTDGIAWTDPQVVDAAATDGHQIMPAMAFAGGRLTLIWYDLRYDESGVFAGFVDEQDVIDAGAQFRHTLDVRGAQAGLEPAWPPSWNVFGVTEAVPGDGRTKISQYLYGAVDPDDGEYKQRNFNRPNLKLYGGGSLPFMGDYIGVAGPQWLPVPGGGWAFNGSAAGGENTVFRSVQAAWTDNRDAIVGEAGDTTATNPDVGYTPPGDTCEPGKASSRNANVYTSRITPGLYLAALGNTKATDAIERAYALTIENGTGAAMRVRVTLAAPAGVAASFTQPSLGLPQETQIELVVDALSSEARTLYIPVTPGTPYPRVDVAALELAPPPGRSALRAALILNGDPANPPLSQPSTSGDPVGTSDTHNPRVENPRVENESTRTPRVENPRVENENVKTPRVENPRVENPRVENPRVENPRVENEGLEAAPFSDITYDVTSASNTTSSFDLEFTAAPLASYAFQFFAWRGYRLPIERDCALDFTEEPQVLFNRPTTSAGDETKRGTIVIRPGETIKVTLRVFDTDPSDGFQPYCTDADTCNARIFGRVTAQAGNVVLGEPTSPPAEATIGTPTPLPDLAIVGTLTPSSTTVTAGLGCNIGISGATIDNIGSADASTDFSWGFYLSTDATITTGDILLATGGTGSLAAGASIPLPTGLPLDPAGLVSGSYYLGIVVDSGSQVIEGDESNNTGVTVVPLSITAGTCIG
jgi:hypothetical protein